jgi:hypothetical protein
LSAGAGGILEGFEPVGYLNVASFAGEVRGCFAGIAFMGGIGSMGKEQFHKIAAIGCGC